MDRDTLQLQAERDKISKHAMPRPTRRRFLKVGALGLLLPLITGCTEYIVGGAAQALGWLFYPKKVSPFGSKITVPGSVADYPLYSITAVREGKFYISHVPEGLLALYWKCKHLGCTVPWKPTEKFEGSDPPGVFHCPCHGSIYLRNGQNVAGPAPAPLDYMDLTISGDKITVDTSKINKRIRFEPDQATKV
jgi:cytochrome b6-f complex iron-sulfur subunit